MQLQILQVCDHNVIDRDLVVETFNIVRSSEGIVDTLPDNITNILNIIDIKIITPEYVVRAGDLNAGEFLIGEIIPESVLYKSPEIYNLYKNTVVWNILNSNPASYEYSIPSANTQYTIVVRYYKASLTKYLQVDCPRCRGTGWYLASIADGENMKEVEGPMLVAQDFIKLLLTPSGSDRVSSGYGTNLMPNVGINYFDDSLINNITTAISTAEFNCKALQLKETWRGIDEILDKVFINSIDKIIEDSIIRISLTLITQAGTKISFNINT